MKTLNKVLTVALLISIIIDVIDFVMKFKKNYIIIKPRKDEIVSFIDMRTNKEYMYDKRSHSFKEYKDYKEKMNIAIVYGVYKHNIQMFYDLNNNLFSPKDYFDTHIKVDHLYFLDIHTNIRYLFNRNDGNEYKISYDFADRAKYGEKCGGLKNIK